MNQPNQAAAAFIALQVQPPNQTLHLIGSFAQSMLVYGAPGFVGRTPDGRVLSVVGLTVRDGKISWSLLIVRDLMFTRKRTYAEFAASEERISTSVLAARLRALTDAGIVRRAGSGRATRYSLTRKGADLLGVMVEMILWSAKYDPDTAAPDDVVMRAKRARTGFLAALEAQMAEDPGLSPVA